MILREVFPNRCGALQQLFSIGKIRGPHVRETSAAFAQVTTATTESDVAETVYRAANDVSGQLRFPAGADAVALAQSA